MELRATISMIYNTHDITENEDADLAELERLATLAFEDTIVGALEKNELFDYIDIEVVTP